MSRQYFEYRVRFYGGAWAEAEEIESALNDQASHGWRLVDVSAPGPEGVLVYFERPIV